MGRFRKRDGWFDESARKNNIENNQYFKRLAELSMTMFDWQNLPDTIDPRFLELTLFFDGQAVFFKDEELGFLCLQCLTSGNFDVYRIPLQRRAIAVNGYNRDLDQNDSVIIYNNYLHCNSVTDCVMFADKLYNLDRIIQVNANAQKTPVLVRATEKQRLTLLNVYQKWDGNAPVIFGDKSLDPNSLEVLSTGAPYVADKLYNLKVSIWNEALTYLGISNTNMEKRERLVSDEVIRSMGAVIASRYSRLESRRQAAKQINEMFDLDIQVDYREDYREASKDMILEGESGGGESDRITAFS